MEATFKLTNSKLGIFAAQTKAGEFVVFDLIDSDEPQTGDVVSHPDFQAPGGKEFKNLTREVTILVFVTNIVANFDHARDLCFLN